MSRVRASTVGTADRPRPMSYVDPGRPGLLDENPPAPISARLPGEGEEGDDEDDAPGGLSQGALTRYGGQGNLADMLSSRPTKEELISRNILKDDKVSPRLQAAQEELKKKQLEDMLNKKIPHRAHVEELVHSNILHADTGVAPALQAAQDSLKRAQIEDEITKNLRERPSVQQLQEKDIIKPAAEEKAGV